MHFLFAMCMSGDARSSLSPPEKPAAHQALRYNVLGRQPVHCLECVVEQPIRISLPILQLRLENKFHSDFLKQEVVQGDFVFLPPKL